jgi:hypothetical protein
MGSHRSRGRPAPTPRITKPSGDDMASLFEIRLKEDLDDRWAEWFEEMTIVRQPDGTTVLSGPVADQSALQGLLRRVADLGMTLLSVNAIAPGAPGPKHS